MLIIGYYHYYAIIATKLKEITHIYKFIYRPDSAALLSYHGSPAAVILASSKGGYIVYPSATNSVTIDRKFYYHRQKIV